jgi:uncharacterized protein YdhG (YjbR/CyaY superfamily)
MGAECAVSCGSSQTPGTAARMKRRARAGLSYGMPTMFQHGVLLHFGAFKQHIGLFPPVTEPVLRE